MRFETFNSERGTRYVVSFRKAKKLYKKHIENDLKKYGLSTNELEIIMYLNREDNDNTARDIAIYLGLSKGMISRTIEQLIEKGILEIQKDKDDKRILRLYLSEASKELTQDLGRASDKFFSNLVSGINEENLDVFASVLEVMIKNLNDFKD